METTAEYFSIQVAVTLPGVEQEKKHTPAPLKSPFLSLGSMIDPTLSPSNGYFEGHQQNK